MQKHVNLVDLVKSFPTNIFLQNLASIQKRTSPIEFAHLAEKSENGSTSNLSTKVEKASHERSRQAKHSTVQKQSRVDALEARVKELEEQLQQGELKLERVKKLHARDKADAQCWRTAGAKLEGVTRPVLFTRAGWNGGVGIQYDVIYCVLPPGVPEYISNC